MIKKKKKICLGCNKPQYIFSLGKCKSCYDKEYKKPIKKKSYIPKVSEKQKLKNIEKAENTKLLHQWFLKIWDEREDEDGYCYCFETGTPMHRRFYKENTCCYHHPLEKGIEKYKQYAMKDFNILIVLPDIHTTAHNNLDKVPKIKEYTKNLKEIYG